MNMLRYTLLLLIVASLLLSVGCEEKDVFTVSQLDEIERFLNDSEDVDDLFRIDSLLTGEPYQLPFDNSVIYVETVDSVVRSEPNISIPGGDNPILVDLGFGQFEFAEVRFSDVLYITRERRGTNDTTEFTYQYGLVRRVLMVKIGDNSQPYSGWLLWGYDGGYAAVLDSARLRSDLGSVKASSPDTLSYPLINPNGNSPAGPLGYSLLTDILEVPVGDSLEIKTYRSGSEIFSTLASYEEDTLGFTTRLLATPSGATFYNRDTLQSVVGSTRLWNLIVFQTVESRPGQVTTSSIWCVPYKVIP